MKSYTDLEQSKKLAEILPLESADNYYSWHDDRYYVVNKDCPYPYSLKEKIPCWSIAALFDVLPEYIKFDGHTWKFYSDHYGVYYMNADTYDTNTFSANNDNPVDSCVEMIIKLHELKML